MSEVTMRNGEDALWRPVCWRWSSACLSFRLTLWTSVHSFTTEAMLKNVALALHRFPQNHQDGTGDLWRIKLSWNLKHRYLGGSFLFITGNSRNKSGAQVPVPSARWVQYFQFNSAILFTGSRASYRKWGLPRDCSLVLLCWLRREQTVSSWS